MQQFREYQHAAAAAAMGSFLGTEPATLLEMATGTGKTTVAAMVAEECIREHQRPTLFVAHREHLVTQAVATLEQHGLRCAVEMGAQDARRSANLFGTPEVVVGTVQSLQGARLASWPRERFGAIITDECHHAGDASHRAIYDHFQGYWHLGLTATPDGSSSGLGDVYAPKPCYRYTIRDGIRDGFLAPIEAYKIPVEIDLRGIRTVAGDFSLSDVAARISPMLEEIAKRSLREIQERPFVAFTPDVSSAAALAQMFAALGTPTRYVAGDGGEFGQSKIERKTVLSEFRARKFQGLVSCDLLFEGWDCPFLEAALICRATKKRYRYAQMAGRVTRISPETGKTNCLILDFDWRADAESRDLVTDISLVDNSIDEPVRQVAKRLMRECGERDPIKAIDDARTILRTYSRFYLTISDRPLDYTRIPYDPVGVAKLTGVVLGKYDKDPWKAGPPSEGQLRYLATLGAPEPGKLSKWGATKLINHLVERREQGLAAPNQVQEMQALGIDPQTATALTFLQAGSAIRDINAANKSLGLDRKSASGG